MIKFRKSTLACVVAASAVAAFAVAADKLPASAAARTVVPPPTALSEQHAPATADQGRFVRANLWAATGPDVEDIRQSRVGDCYFDATMAAVAHTQPARIMRAIDFDPSNGNFLVHIHNYAEGRDYIPGTHGDGKPWPSGLAVVPTSVVVTQQDVKNDIRAGGASGLDDGAPGYIWPAVMEAAYAKMLFGEYPSHPEADGAANAGDAGLWIAEARNPANPFWSGGDVDQGMASVTGETGVYTPADLSSYDTIASALAEHRPVTMGTAPASSSLRYQDRLVLNHQYTVLGVAKDADGAVKLTVRNPWGSNSGVPGVEDQTAGAVVVDLRQALDHKAIGSFDIGPAFAA